MVAWLDGFTLARFSEVVVRTTIIFFFTFLVMRIRGQRQLAHLNLFDLVIIIGLGSAVGDAMIYGDEVVHLLTSMTAIATIVILIWGVENILERSPYWLVAIIEGKSTVLVRNGKIVKEALRKINLHEEELRAKLRESNVHSISGIREVRLEPDGGISITRKRPPTKKQAESKNL
ncbi:hypothetical protein COT72_03610 [archaeon CG10_big_fil_rev_8_21_14_0_10_43_11]|nr:MAG: hypothetical protein COT72_03610 [archaeon CG10_big_fil_rev_8_21_14_0_10_43_11]